MNIQITIKKYLLLVLGLFAVAGASAETGDIQCLVNASNELAENPIIFRELLAFNLKAGDPLLLEARWSELTSKSPEVLTIIENPASVLIRKFIARYSIQGEGFLVGLNGGLVAATNKTTDYFQADEPQFTETIKLKKGEIRLERHIADKSAAAFLVKIAVPVFLPTKLSDPRYRAGGVLVIGLDEFVLDLHKACTSIDRK